MFRATFALGSVAPVRCLPFNALARVKGAVQIQSIRKNTIQICDEESILQAICFERITFLQFSWLKTNILLSPSLYLASLTNLCHHSGAKLILQIHSSHFANTNLFVSDQHFPTKPPEPPLVTNLQSLQQSRRQLHATSCHLSSRTPTGHHLPLHGHVSLAL